MMMWEVGYSYIVPMMGEVRDLCQTKLCKNNLTIGLTLPCLNIETKMNKSFGIDIEAKGTSLFQIILYRTFFY
jgi:hypothetical protein